MTHPHLDDRTTVAVQRYLTDLAAVDGSTQAEPLVRELLGRAVDRLYLLCGRMLHHKYPRLTRGPMNLTTDELVSAVVERLLKAMREVRPGSVRQFFGLANKHLRWELNDLARHLDRRTVTAELHDSRVAAPEQPDPAQFDSAESAPAGAGAELTRILDAIEALPHDEREVFELVRIQGMTHPEAASIAGVSEKTVQRRLHRALLLLGERLGDLVSPRGGGGDADPDVHGVQQL